MFFGFAFVEKQILKNVQKMHAYYAEKGKPFQNMIKDHFILKVLDRAYAVELAVHDHL